ncbi:kinase-like domain-containing protein [Sphaerosporella brunnea]|uniref:Kinase-like domain-containing protein n=1 Tax=Sphaerosporella brunnea TaxID=1250544 RepID=A0A5J5ER87_9PEZI|nr:kinase-like domain-containing protein [Sphaerosporella brunnea]
MVSGFEITGLVGAVHTSIDLLDRLSTLIQDYLHYDTGVADLSRRFSTDSQTLSHILQVLKNLNASAENINLPDEDAKLHSDIEAHLVLLEQRLRFRVDKLAGGGRNGGGGSGFAAKSAWTLWRKRDLERLEAELSNWINRVHVIYSAIEAEVRTRRGYKATTMEERIGVLRDIFTGLTRQPVDESSLLISESDLHEMPTNEPTRRVTATFQDTPTSSFPVIIEYISKAYSHNLTPDEVSTIGTAVRELAKVLYYAAPEQTRILKCRGYFHEPKTCRFGIVYEIPPGVAPHNSKHVDPHGETKPQGKSKVLSLRDLLNRIPRFSLSDRLKFVCELAKALVYVHLVGWVHKSVRPDNILILEDPSLPEARRFPYVLPPPFLAGFEYARSVKTASDRRSDAEWHLNLYRHPKRQFLERNSEYTMAHDVYSLGVILLELGLWGSNGFKPFQAREELFTKKTGEQIKEVFLGLAEGENATAASKNKGVAFQMGDRYAGLVRLCLNIDEKQELPTAAFIQDLWLALDEMRSAMV